LPPTRHCPKWPSAAARDWAAFPRADLLPVGPTFPPGLHALRPRLPNALLEQAVVYDPCCSHPRPERCSPSPSDPKHLGRPPSARRRAPHMGALGDDPTTAISIWHRGRAAGYPLDGRHWGALSDPGLPLYPVTGCCPAFPALFLAALRRRPGGGVGLVSSASPRVALGTLETFRRATLSPLKRKNWFVSRQAAHLPGPRQCSSYPPRYTQPRAPSRNVCSQSRRTRCEVPPQGYRRPMAWARFAQ